MVVLLAGSLRPSPLREALGLPLLLLPLLSDERLVDRWLDSIRATFANAPVHIAVNNRRDARMIFRYLAARHQELPASAPRADVRIAVDPAPWRGPAGVVADIARAAGVADGSLVIAAESAALPPQTLEALRAEGWKAASGARLSTPLRPGARLSTSGLTPAGLLGCHGSVIAAASNDEPAGLYALGSAALQAIPSVGFFDLKEQLLPALHERGLAVGSARLAHSVIRLRNRASYLHAVAARLNAARLEFSCSAAAEVEETAQITPGSVIQRDAVIAAGAVIHESVIMPGGCVGANAVVSRSIVGPGAQVPGGALVRDAVAAPSPAAFGHGTGMEEVTADAA